jgi:hypothetical protein
MPHLASGAQLKWGKWCGSAVQHSPRGGKIYTLNEKIYFPCSTNFKFLRKVNENSINNCEFLFFYFYLFIYFILFFLWQPLLLLAPGIRKPSYAKSSHIVLQ